MSQETVSEGGSLGELDGENAPEQNENRPAVDGNTPQVHEGNLTGRKHRKYASRRSCD